MYWDMSGPSEELPSSLLSSSSSSRRGFRINAGDKTKSGDRAREKERERPKNGRLRLKIAVLEFQDIFKSVYGVFFWKTGWQMV